jgi:uroporphyrinogen decarboxylase
MASFMVEGAMSRHYSIIKKMMFTEPELFLELMDKITRHTVNYLRAQAEAGAQALMLFDSFAEMIGPADFEALNLPFVKRIFADLGSTGVPLIYFALGANASLPELRDCGADVIGIDYKTDLSRAVEILGDGVSVQGNVDPYVLFQSPGQIEKRVKSTLRDGRSARGHIMNLGHGIVPDTPVEGVKAFVRAVHEHG